VIEAADGSQAISICERANQPLELLISDIVMPLMSGPELARRVKAVRPHLPTLLISGYTTERSSIRASESGNGRSPEAVHAGCARAKVREILDEQQRAAA